MEPKKEKQVEKNKQERKYLDMVIEGKLKDPPPPIIERISAELGLEIHSG